MRFHWITSIIIIDLIRLLVDMVYVSCSILTHLVHQHYRPNADAKKLPADGPVRRISENISMVGDRIIVNLGL